MRQYGIVLAGGLGKRMGMLGELLPKALLPVGPSTLLDRHISAMRQSGMDHILVVYHPVFEQQFQIWYTSKATQGVSISLVKQRPSFGYGGAAALKAALGECYFPVANYLVVCADGYYPNGYGDITDTSAYVALGASYVNETSKFGKIEQDGKYAVKLTEKPIHGGPGTVSTGLYWFPHKQKSLKDVVESLTTSKRGELEISDVAKAYIAEGKAVISPIPSGDWIDVGTYADYVAAWQNELRAIK